MSGIFNNASTIFNKLVAMKDKISYNTGTMFLSLAGQLNESGVTAQ